MRNVNCFSSRSLKPRGFCFIIFQDESSLDLVLSERTHTIDGRNVECTRAVGREVSQNSSSDHNHLLRSFFRSVRTRNGI